MSSSDNYYEDRALDMDAEESAEECLVCSHLIEDHDPITGCRYCECEGA